MDKKIKQFYRDYHDRISHKRWNSPHPLRRYVHRLNYKGILNHVRDLVPDGGRVLDAGCGDGLLTYFIANALAESKVTVIGIDISQPNILAAQERLSYQRLPNLHYHLGDAERLPYRDQGFDLVISSHVLEHLPDFNQGLAEVHRLAKHYAIVALPTCLNPCAMVQLGNDVFWRVSRRSVFALWIGLARVLLGTRREGVDEGYAGKKSLPHRWRYPWVMRSQLQQARFRIEHFEAQSLCIPYLSSLFPKIFLRIQVAIDKLRTKPIFRSLGYGSLAVISKVKKQGDR